MILTAVEARKDTTLAELAEMLRVEYGASSAWSMVRRRLDRHPHLQKAATRPSRTAPTWPGCAAWFEQQPDLDPQRLVFIDKTRAPRDRGDRCGSMYLPPYSLNLNPVRR